MDINKLYLIKMLYLSYTGIVNIADWIFSFLHVLAALTVVPVTSRFMFTLHHHMVNDDTREQM